MKKLNHWINISLIFVDYLLVISLAWICSNAFWWIFNPIGTNTYADTVSLKQFEDSAKYITNRAPFGVVVVEAPKQAVISDDIKLTGIYLNTVQDSIAFLEVNKKPIIVKVGDLVLPTVVLDKIYPDKIVLKSNDGDVELHLKQGDGSAITSIVQPPRDDQPDNSDVNNSRDPNVFSQDPGDEVKPSMEELRERRRNLINEMINKENQNNNRNDDSK